MGGREPDGKLQGSRDDRRGHAGARGRCALRRLRLDREHGRLRRRVRGACRAWRRSSSSRRAPSPAESSRRRAPSGRRSRLRANFEEALAEAKELEAAGHACPRQLAQPAPAPGAEDRRIRDRRGARRRARRPRASVRRRREPLRLRARLRREQGTLPASSPHRPRTAPGLQHPRSGSSSPRTQRRRSAPLADSGGAAPSIPRRRRSSTPGGCSPARRASSASPRLPRDWRRFSPTRREARSRLRHHRARPQGSGRSRMKIHVRAPATTANIGPGFDCVAAALDLWNELEVEEGDGELDESHLGVQAFAQARSDRGQALRVHEPDPARAGPRLERGGDRARPRRRRPGGRRGARPGAASRRSGVELEGHADNLAAALAGGVCLTWENRIVRVADSLPAVPFALVPEATVSTAEARNSLPDSVPHRGRGLHRGPRCAPRRRARAGLCPSSSPRRSRTGCTSRTAPRTHRSSRGSARDLPDGALGATLSGSGPTRDRLGAGGGGRGLRGGARPPLRRRECASLHGLRPKEQDQA